MRVSIQKLIKHLKTQLEVAKSLQSNFAYITVNEAKKCLELAEAQDLFLSKPVKSELEGSGNTWWYVCGECHGSISWGDKYCKCCGRKVEWDDLP